MSHPAVNPPDPRRVPNFVSRLPQASDQFHDWDSLVGHLDETIGAIEELRTHATDNAITAHMTARRLYQINAALRLISLGLDCQEQLFQEERGNHIWATALMHYTVGQEADGARVHVRDRVTDPPDRSLCGTELKYEYDNLTDLAEHGTEKPMCVQCSIEISRRVFTPGALRPANSLTTDSEEHVKYALDERIHNLNRYLGEIFNKDLIDPEHAERFFQTFRDRHQAITASNDKAQPHADDTPGHADDHR